MDQADTLMTSISMAEGGVFYPNIFPFEDIQNATNLFEQSLETSYAKQI